ncbi:MAG: hemolysin family protein [Gemmatimonadota bacterium]
MLLAWFGLVLAVSIATLCASADGALLALDPNDRLTDSQRSRYERRERTHRALAFARVIAQLGAGFCVAFATGMHERGAAERTLIAAVAALLIVGGSESYARSRGHVEGPAGVDRLRWFITLIEYLLAPIVILGQLLDGLLVRLLPPLTDHEEDMAATAEQFKQIVASEAEVSREQQVLLNGVFRLGQTKVEDLMVPRVDMVALDRDASWSEAVQLVLSSEHARLPVYAGTIDNIVGILYAKDLISDIVAGAVPDDWTNLLKPPVFIPDGKSADEQLRHFQHSGTHIAIVADEFGGTAGLITIEDVLEEIVGEIRDEYDKEEIRVEQEGGYRFWVSARLTLDELSDLLGNDFRHEQVSTVGGLVYELLGRVPRAGEEFNLNGYRVVVERILRRRVQRVYFERLNAVAARNGGGAGVT